MVYWRKIFHPENRNHTHKILNFIFYKFLHYSALIAYYNKYLYIKYQTQELKVWNILISLQDLQDKSAFNFTSNKQYIWKNKQIYIQRDIISPKYLKNIDKIFNKKITEIPRNI